MEPDHPWKFFLYMLFIAFGWSIFFSVKGIRESKESSGSKQYYDFSDSYVKLNIGRQPRESDFNFKPYQRPIPIQKNIKEKVPLIYRTKSQDDQTNSRLTVYTRPSAIKNNPEPSSRLGINDTTKTSLPDSKSKTSEIKATKEANKKKKIIIRYYRRFADGNRIDSLDQLDYYIHERPLNEVDSTRLSNALYYGDDVSLAELKLIASKLIESGFPIKAVKQSKYHDGWKSASIEIGFDSDLANQTILTVKDISSLQKK